MILSSPTMLAAPRLYDVSSTHVSYLISDLFKYSHLVLASVTYNLVEGRGNGHLLIQDGHILQGLDLLLHQRAGAGRPGAAAHNGDGAFLEVQGLHVREEIVHGREDAQVIGESEIDALADAIAASIKGESK